MFETVSPNLKPYKTQHIDTSGNKASTVWYCVCKCNGDNPMKTSLSHALTPLEL